MTLFFWFFPNVHRLPEEKEDNHGRAVGVRGQTGLRGGPAEGAHALLLGQEVRDRAGGAQAAR